MWFEKFWVEVLHLRHHTCGSWGSGPFPQVSPPPGLLARCGRSPSSCCRHVDNSTAVHSDRRSSPGSPLVAPRPSPCRVHAPAGGSPDPVAAGGAGRVARAGRGAYVQVNASRCRPSGSDGSCPADDRRASRTGTGADLPNLCTFLGTTSRRVDRMDGRRPGSVPPHQGFRCPRSSTQLWTATCRPPRRGGGRPRQWSATRRAGNPRPTVRERPPRSAARVITTPRCRATSAARRVPEEGRLRQGGIGVRASRVPQRAAAGTGPTSASRGRHSAHVGAGGRHRSDHAEWGPEGPAQACWTRSAQQGDGGRTPSPSRARGESLDGAVTGGRGS